MKHSHLKRACLPFHHLGIVSWHKGSTFFYFAILLAKNIFLALIAVSVTVSLYKEQAVRNLVLEEFPVESAQIYHRHRNIGVGKVEDSTEEVVVVIHQERQPVGYVVPLE